MYKEDTFLSGVDEGTIKFLSEIIDLQYGITDKGFGFISNKVWHQKYPDCVSAYYKQDIFNIVPSNMTDKEFAALKYFIDKPEENGVLLFDFNLFKQQYAHLKDKRNYLIALAAHEIIKEIDHERVFGDYWDEEL